ncbi:Uncharacterised protein [Bordetella pertussis]|nr:Uncharacterised protein [Bordetella pertussis]
MRTARTASACAPSCSRSARLARTGVWLSAQTG